MATARNRKRKRAVETSPKGSKVTAEMQSLAVEFHTENQKALEHSKKAKAARAALFTQMKEAGVATFDTVTTTPGGTLSLEAAIGAGRKVREVIIEKLRKIVTKNQFDEIVEASGIGITAVKNVAGEDTLTRCTIVSEGTENVSVKPKK